MGVQRAAHRDARRGVVPKAHPREVQQAALAAYLDVGPRQAGRDTGLPVQTVQSIAKRHGMLLSDLKDDVRPWAEKRLDVADAFGQLAVQCMSRAKETLDEGTEKSMHTQRLLTSAAIAVDKAQLLSGGATSQHLSLSGTLEQAAELQEQLRTRAKQDK